MKMVQRRNCFRRFRCHWFVLFYGCVANGVPCAVPCQPAARTVPRRRKGPSIRFRAGFRWHFEGARKRRRNCWPMSLFLCRYQETSQLVCGGRSVPRGHDDRSPAPGDVSSARKCRSSWTSLPHKAALSLVWVHCEF